MRGHLGLGSDLSLDSSFWALRPKLTKGFNELLTDAALHTTEVAVAQPSVKKTVDNQILVLVFSFYK